MNYRLSKPQRNFLSCIIKDTDLLIKIHDHNSHFTLTDKNRIYLLIQDFVLLNNLQKHFYPSTKPIEISYKVILSCLQFFYTKSITISLPNDKDNDKTRFKFNIKTNDGQVTFYEECLLLNILNEYHYLNQLIKVGEYTYTLPLDIKEYILDVFHTCSLKIETFVKHYNKPSFYFGFSNISHNTCDLLTSQYFDKLSPCSAFQYRNLLLLERKLSLGKKESLKIDTTTGKHRLTTDNFEKLLLFINRISLEFLHRDFKIGSFNESNIPYHILETEMTYYEHSPLYSFKIASLVKPLPYTVFSTSKYTKDNCLFTGFTGKHSILGLLNIHNLSIKTLFEDKNAFNFVVSPNKRYVFMYIDNSFTLLDIKTNQFIRHSLPFNYKHNSISNITAVCFSPDSRSFFIAYGQGFIRKYDICLSKHLSVEIPWENNNNLSLPYSMSVSYLVYSNKLLYVYNNLLGIVVVDAYKGVLKKLINLPRDPNLNLKSPFEFSHIDFPCVHIRLPAEKKSYDLDIIDSIAIEADPPCTKIGPEYFYKITSSSSLLLKRSISTLVELNDFPNSISNVFILTDDTILVESDNNYCLYNLSNLNLFKDRKTPTKKFPHSPDAEDVINFVASICYDYKKYNLSPYFERGSNTNWKIVDHKLLNNSIKYYLRHSSNMEAEVINTDNYLTFHSIQKK